MLLDKFRTATISFRDRPLESACLVLAGIVMIPAGMSLIQFAVAYTPDEAKLVGVNLPDGWSAGVPNHGRFMQWWTIADAPVLFGVSLIAFIVSIGLIYWKAFTGNRSESE